MCKPTLFPSITKGFPSSPVNVGLTRDAGKAMLSVTVTAVVEFPDPSDTLIVSEPSDVDIIILDNCYLVISGDSLMEP